MHPDSSQKASGKEREFSPQDLGWSRLEVSVPFGKEKEVEGSQKEGERIAHAWHFLAWKLSDCGIV